MSDQEERTRISIAPHPHVPVTAQAEVASILVGFGHELVTGLLGHHNVTYLAVEWSRGPTSQAFWLTVKFGRPGAFDEAEFLVRPTWDQEKKKLKAEDLRIRIPRESVGQNLTEPTFRAEALREGLMTLLMGIIQLYWWYRKQNDQAKADLAADNYRYVVGFDEVAHRAFGNVII